MNTRIGWFLFMGKRIDKFLENTNNNYKKTTMIITLLNTYFHVEAWS